MRSENRNLTSPTTRKYLGVSFLRRSRWLIALLLLMASVPMLAQKDVITVTGAKAGVADDGASFKTGTASTEYPGMYVVDVGDASVEEGMFAVTLSRPLGATAKRAATVTLSYMPMQGMEMTEIFEPGETEKTVELPGFLEAANYGSTGVWSGNLPAMYTIRTTYAEAEYDALMIKVNRIPTEEVPQCEFATKLEVLQNTQGNDRAFYDCYRWGDYLLMRFFMDTYVKVGADSRYVINARFADHTNLTADDDDYGLAQTHEVELHPINAGSVCSEAWYLYRPSNDEYLHSLDNNISEWTERAVQYPVLEVGPFEVANPAEDGVKYIFYSRADLPEESANALFPVYLYVDGLMPQFSNVSINKTSFKSGETMVITATMDNWQFVKRGQGKWFRTAFGVTLDDNQTLEPSRYTLDETTGRVTYYVTAPAVDETKTINVDFGAAKEDVPGGDKAVISRAESSFAVTISPEAAAGNPVTKMEFVGLPAEGNAIILKKEVFGGGIGENVHAKKYPLIVDMTPMDATDANEINYSVTNSGGASASINYGDGFNGSVLNTGQTNGTITVTASLPSGVSVSRSFSVVVGTGSEKELLAMPEPKNHINHYYIGTVFPQFQFEINNPDNWPVDDAITVNYTHANGTAWTETYSLKTLKRHQTDRGTTTYDLPFSFTEEHPDVTDDSQIGGAVITAQVVMSVPTVEGPKETITCTAMLMSDLKQISFGDYSEKSAYYNEVHPVTLTSEVMYLPRVGFTVGYEIPELGIKETYNNKSGDPVPEWLELAENDYYCTANITVHPTPNPSISRYNFFTLAQRSYSPDEVMLRELTSIADFIYVGAEGHIVYQVNGEDVTGNLTFDNTEDIQGLMNYFNQHAFYTDIIDPDPSLPAQAQPLVNPLHLPKALFEVKDDFYEGANITLKCGDKVIQTINGYRGRFFFQPPADGQTYDIEVYYPGYGRRYTSTFKSRDLSNFYHVNLVISSFYEKGQFTFSFSKDDETYSIAVPHLNKTDYTYDNYLKGIIHIENPNNCYLSVGGQTIRTPFGSYLTSLSPNTIPVLRYVNDNGPVEEVLKGCSNDPYNNLYAGVLTGSDWRSYNCNERSVMWESLTAGSTQVTVVNSKGEAIKNAKLHYACIDANMNSLEPKGTATFNTSVGCYPVSTDPYLYAELIEVEAEGYKPMLTKMDLWNYNYFRRENLGKSRRHTIVLQEVDDKFNNLALETLKRDGNLKDNKMDAAINSDDLLSINSDATLNYSQTADYENVIKRVVDKRFGKNGWSGTKYAHLTGCMPYQTAPNLTLATADGSWSLQPTQKLLTTDNFPFSTNYCMFDFDLTDQIATDATVHPLLKNGSETLANLPSLHNHTIDLTALNEANNIEMEPGGFDLTEVDNQAAANGTDMKDMNKAFDKFNFQMPPVLPFTVNIERDGDYFLVRAVCEKNFVPGGEVMDALDELGDLQYFDEQFQACMDAVNSAEPADDDFFDDIPRWPSAFVGIKGYLCGIGYIDPDNGNLQINFYAGGLTFEASAAASANLSFGIGSFGMSIDAKIAMTMGLINTAAEMGDVSLKSTKIDFMFDYQTRLKVCAWAYAGIDIWIAKAVAGVRGGACIDLHHRAYIRKGQAGMKTTLHAQMEAFAEVRFLFWKAKKTWPIFKAHKEYLVPNSPTNPFHPDNDEPIFDLSRRNVTKGYKRLKRKVIADLGTPIIEKVNGMAQPTYLMDGKSLLFNNLKSAKDYNDDRLQVYADGSKNDFINTGVDAPMYDFSTSRNPFFEVAAFEQLEEAVDGKAIDTMSETDQTKTVSERSRIRMAWRLRDGDAVEEAPMRNWETMEASSVSEKVACVNPVVAVTSSTEGDLTKWSRGAVVWQQGLAKFNDEGNRYIDGSLMLKRHSFYYSSDLNTEPMEIKRLNRRNVPVDYQVAMKDDSVLVMMTLKQDVDNQEKGASVVYVSVSPDDKVRERYTMIEGSKPQMVNVAGGILVAYLKQDKEGRDLVLNTVNMRGEATGKVSGSLGMERRMINDYKLVTQRNGGVSAELSNVALLWSQSDEERTDNGDGTTTVIFKNRIYASMLCSNDKLLYFSAPVEIATMPDDVTLVSMDGYLDGLDMKVAYCVANEEDGSAVLETEFTFTNAMDHKLSFNPYEVNDNDRIPVKLTVVNNGIDPIIDLVVKINEKTTQRRVSLMPQQSTELMVEFPVPDDFDGTIDYDVTAFFATANSNALKSRRLGAAARPRRVSQSGTQVDVRQVDMALKMLSKRTVGGVTTIVAEVNNASMLPLADDVSVKVGLYDSPLAAEKAKGTTEVTVSTTDLYDADNKQNKVKIVTLTAQAPDFDKVLFLRTTPMQGTEVLTDTKPSNNVVPVSLKGKYLLGDINGDGKVDVSDYIGIANHILGTTPAGFIKEAGDVDRDGKIDVSDYIGVANIILTGSIYGK